MAAPGAGRWFALAPMSRDVRAVTTLVLALPAVFVVLGLTNPTAPVRWILLACAALQVGGGALVWWWVRPSGFEVTPGTLVVVWPGRRRAVSRQAIQGVRRLDRAAFRREYGPAVRVGVGGLWGVFGSLRTARRGALDVYASRSDEAVVIERAGARPLVVTPERPGEFVAALGAGSPAGRAAVGG